jgi:hypothetical protein
MKRKILLLVIIIFVGIQFIPVEENKSDTFSKDDFILTTNPPEDIGKLLKNSCYDCHSNTSKYPWYDKIAPVSWWVADHIDHAKGELNFSEWDTYTPKKKKHKLEEIVEETFEGEMPLKSYLWMHGDAKLSDEQLKQLKQWISTMK